MKTLVLGRPGAERTELIRKLTDGGLSVSTCHDDAWGCAGLQDECPLDDGPIDAAVAFAAPGESLDPQGVACARRARVPIVAVGGIAGDPLHRLADVGVDIADETISTVVSAAALAGARHRRAIESAAPSFLHDGEELVVDVHRNGSTIQVSMGGRFAEDRIGQIADQVRAAVREFDAGALVLDVSVDRATLDTDVA